jgi:hypothetical protein
MRAIVSVGRALSLTSPNEPFRWQCECELSWHDFVLTRALDSIGGGGVNRVTLWRVQKAREMCAFESQMDGERSADVGTFMC